MRRDEFFIEVVKWKEGGLSVGFYDGESETHLRLGLGWDGCMVSAIRNIPKSSISGRSTCRVDDIRALNGKP
jgi:hypothetical protein